MALEGVLASRHMRLSYTLHAFVAYWLARIRVKPRAEPLSVAADVSVAEGERTRWETFPVKEMS